MVTTMRHALALALLLVLVVACSSAPAPTRCTPGASVACVCPGVGTGAQVCAADGASYGVCACGVDAGGGTEDRPAAMDVVGVDRPDVWMGTDPVPLGDRQDVAAASDVVDAGAAADVDPRQTPTCQAVTQECDRRIVNVQTGERDGGVTYHCGGCGITCGVGQGCLTCVCIPL